MKNSIPNRDGNKMCDVRVMYSYLSPREPKKLCTLNNLVFSSRIEPSTVKFPKKRIFVRKSHLAAEFEEFLNARLADSGGAARDQSHLAPQIHARGLYSWGIHDASQVQPQKAINRLERLDTHTRSRNNMQRKSRVETFENLSRSVGQLARSTLVCGGVGGERGAAAVAKLHLHYSSAVTRPCAAGCISWRSLIERGRKYTQTAQAGGFFLAGGQADGRAAPLFANNSRPTGRTLLYVPECECISHNAPLLLIFVCSVHAGRMIHQKQAHLCICYVLCSLFNYFCTNSQ